MKLFEEVKNLIVESVHDSVMKNAKDKNLKFEKSDKSDSVSSIAFSEKNRSWIGFSHRAMAEFKIGDRLFDAEFKGEGSLNDVGELEKMPFNKRGSIIIKTIGQARKAAVNFAEYVS